MKRWLLLTWGIAALGGCGPITFPMVQRLEPQEQQAVDNAWNNSLSGADLTDRQGLLDVILSYQLHQMGVDKLTLRSEKTWANGVVVMEVHFDRLNPAVDRFDVSIFDPAWRQMRRESYRREEIERTLEELWDKQLEEEPRVDEQGRPLPPAADLGIRRAVREARIKRVEAATRPALQP